MSPNNISRCYGVTFSGTFRLTGRIADFDSERLFHPQCLYHCINRL